MSRATEVTATIAIEDRNDGEVRNTKAAVEQIACGGIAGAAIGYIGAYVMPFGVGTMGTQATFGVLSGATMRTATSGAMEHLDWVDRLGYVFNPLYIAEDTWGAAFVGALVNRSALGTACPTPGRVNSHNAAQQTAVQADRTVQDPSERVDPSATESTQQRGSGSARPTWRQSEIDAAANFPDYDAQKSFLGGEEDPYGTKGSVRPDYYKDGFSVDIKNYKIETTSGRMSLARNIENQYYQRLENLPEGTQQYPLIDIRGQPVSNEDLRTLYNEIIKSTGNGIEVLFKMD